MQPPEIICIEGNIGAGKSTALQILKDRGYTVIPEPVQEWAHVFPLFASNPKRYTFLFQVQVAASLAAQYNDAVLALSRGTKGNVVFVERSFASANAFVEVAYLQKWLSPAENHTYANVIRELQWRPSKYIFVATPLTTCLDRIKSRGRTEEKDITLERLEHIRDAFCRAKITHCSVDGSAAPSAVADSILKHAS